MDEVIVLSPEGGDRSDAQLICNGNDKTESEEEETSSTDENNCYSDVKLVTPRDRAAWGMTTSILELPFRCLDFFRWFRRGQNQSNVADIVNKKQSDAVRSKSRWPGLPCPARVECEQFLSSPMTYVPHGLCTLGSFRATEGEENEQDFRKLIAVAFRELNGIAFFQVLLKKDYEGNEKLTLQQYGKGWVTHADLQRPHHLAAAQCTMPAVQNKKRHTARFLLVSCGHLGGPSQALLCFEVTYSDNSKGLNLNIITRREAQLGQGSGELHGPNGLAVSDSHCLVFVADTYNNRIQVFTIPGLIPVAMFTHPTLRQPVALSLRYKIIPESSKKSREDSKSPRKIKTILDKIYVIGSRGLYCLLFNTKLQRLFNDNLRQRNKHNEEATPEDDNDNDLDKYMVSVPTAGATPEEELSSPDTVEGSPEKAVDLVSKLSVPSKTVTSLTNKNGEENVSTNSFMISTDSTTNQIELDSKIPVIIPTKTTFNSETISTTNILTATASTLSDKIDNSEAAAGIEDSSRTSSVTDQLIITENSTVNPLSDKFITTETTIESDQSLFKPDHQSVITTRVPLNYITGDGSETKTTTSASAVFRAKSETLEKVDLVLELAGCVDVMTYCYFEDLILFVAHSYDWHGRKLWILRENSKNISTSHREIFSCEKIGELTLPPGDYPLGLTGIEETIYMTIRGSSSVGSRIVGLTSKFFNEIANKSSHYEPYHALKEEWNMNPNVN